LDKHVIASTAGSSNKNSKSRHSQASIGEAKKIIPEMENFWLKRLLQYLENGIENWDLLKNLIDNLKNDKNPIDLFEKNCGAMLALMDIYSL